MNEYQSEPQTPIDFSSDRDLQLQELADALPYLSINDAYFSKVSDRETIEEKASFPTYAKKRVFGEREITSRLHLAPGVLIRPLAVWRDFRQGENNRQGLTLEYFFGLFKNPSGEPIGILLTVTRNVLILINTDKSPVNLLSEISGLQIFKRF